MDSAYLSQMSNIDISDETPTNLTVPCNTRRRASMCDPIVLTEIAKNLYPSYPNVRKINILFHIFVYPKNCKLFYLLIDLLQLVVYLWFYPLKCKPSINVVIFLFLITLLKRRLDCFFLIFINCYRNGLKSFPYFLKIFIY